MLLHRTSTDLVEQIARKFHAHEDSAHEEGNQNAHGSHTQQQNAIQSRSAWLVSLVENDESETSHREQEARRKTLHDVLAINTILHERHRTRVSTLICC